MDSKNEKALNRLIMYEKIKRFRQEHRSIRWIARNLNLNFRTVRKYLEMDQLEFEQFTDKNLSRPFILNPYKDFIVKKLSQYQDTPAAQMHDLLKENYPDFPKVSPKTVYNYVMKIRQDYNLPMIAENKRQYNALPDTPPGECGQVDFGHTNLRTGDGKRITVHFICIILCHSRYKFVWFQDRPFTSSTAIEGHEKAFNFFHGIPKKMIYDQDAVFLYDENAGDYHMTQLFDIYVKGRPFDVIYCRPADPESKGLVENCVKYVKRNFLLNRQYSTLENLNKEAIAWLERTGNGMIHATTCKVPFDEWCKECNYLLPYIPMTVPEVKNGYKVYRTNCVKYHGNSYSVPLGTYKDESTRAYLSEENGDLIIRDEDDKLLARHTMPSGRGHTITNTNHMRDKSVSIATMCDNMIEQFTNKNNIVIFLSKIKERYPRYVRDQLSILNSCITTYGIELADKVLGECIKCNLFSANDFKQIISSNPVVEQNDTEEIKPLGDSKTKLMVNIEPRKSSIEVYDELFNNR